MNTKNANIPSLASIIPVDMLQTEVARRLMGMTISDLIKQRGIFHVESFTPHLFLIISSNTNLVKDSIESCFCCSGVLS